MQNFRARLGRWRKETIRAVLNPTWWIVLEIANRARQPLMHHFAVVRTSNKTNVLETMVHGKAIAIATEMVALGSYNSKVWARKLALAMDDLRESSIDISDVLELGVTLNFHHFASYWRRVVLDCKRLPNALFLLTLSPPQESCQQRQRVAKCVLETPLEKLDSNVRKLRQRCLEEFESTARSGKLGPILHTTISAWSSSAKSDVAINEGHNSLIKAISGRCKNIGLPLLSARANTKKELRVGVRGAPVKWSNVKKSALVMVQDRTVTGTDKTSR